MSKMSYPEGILFDWDNTLVDTTYLCFNAFSKVMHSFNKKAPSYNEFLSMPPYSAQRLFQEVFPKESDRATALFYHFLPSQHPVPMKSAADLLKCIDQQDIPMAVVSNKKGDCLRREVQVMGWHSYFFAVVGAGDAARDKPFADPLHHALNHHDTLLPGPGIWFVGDSFVDKECAENAQCTSIMIQDNIQDGFPLFHSCSSFLSYLKQMFETKDL